MKIKRLLSLLMMLLALSMLFVGCDKSKDKAPEDAAEPAGDAAADSPSDLDADQEIELSVQVEEGWLPHYENAANRIKERMPNANFKFLVVGSFDHLETIDSTDVMNKDVADLFAYPLDRYVTLTDKDALAAIDAPQMAADLGGWSDFNAGIGDALHTDANYFGFPYNIETLIIFANEKNAADNNIDLSKPLELATVEAPETALLPIFDAWFGVALTNSAEIELLGKNEDGSLFSDFSLDWADLSPEKQAFIEAIHRYWKLNFDANSSLFDADAGWGYIEDNFRSGGKGVLRLDGPWATGSIKELTNDGADIGVYSIDHITVNGSPLRHWQGGWALGVNARVEEDPAKLALAQEMIKEIVNPEFAVDLFKATGKILENVESSVYEASDLDPVEKEVIAAVIKSYGQSPNRPLFQEWNAVWDTYKHSILSWNSVKPATPEEAYKELQASFEALLAQN
ncbi:MAG: hypothetical protein Q4P08_00565 [Eubacteriales bacterium]|nr:hypothetical protein [Eubacteriales bacterium]